MEADRELPPDLNFDDDPDTEWGLEPDLDFGEGHCPLEPYPDTPCPDSAHQDFQD